MEESAVSTETARVRERLRRTRVVAVLVAVGTVVPWSVQVFTARDATWLFSWGLVNTNPVQVTTITDFLFVYTQGLPEFILAWPASVVCYLLALGSAAAGTALGRSASKVRFVPSGPVTRTPSTGSPSSTEAESRWTSP